MRSKKDAWKIRVLELSSDRKGVFCYTTRERAMDAAAVWLQKGHNVIISGLKMVPIMKKSGLIRMDETGRIHGL